MQYQYTVLIIDDCLEDRNTYRRYLEVDEKYIYTFLETEYGENGLELCLSTQPDAILLDYMLPDMDGLEFLQELKDCCHGSIPPVVMLTGGGSEAIAVQAMKYGVKDYLVKGDTTAEILRLTVRNTIEKNFLQQELEANKRRFFASVENMLDCFGIYVCIRDDLGKIAKFSSQYLNTAAGENNLIGLQESGTKQEHELFEQYCQVVETGEPLSREVLCFIQNDNEQVLSKAYDIRISKLEDGFVATWRDITQRKQSEQALQESQHLIQQIADTTPDILYLFDLKEKRNIYINRQVTKRLGYFPEQIQEMGVDLVLDLIHPDDLKRLKNHYQQLKSVNDGEILQFEYRMRHHKGEWHWFSSRDTVFTRTEDAQPRQILGVVREITSQKQSEQALRKSEARFRRIFESNMLGIMFWETNGKIADANTRFLEIIGYSRSDLQAGAIRWDNLTPPEWEEVDQEAIEQIRINQVCHPFEKEYLRKDGSRVPILLGASLLEDSGKMGVSFILDITKRKHIEKERTRLLISEREAREQAEAANRAKDEFVSMVSHDLRSPLNAILGWSRILQKNGDNEVMRNRALEIIERNALAQDALIKDLLDVSRMVQGRLELQIDAVKLQSIVTQAIESALPVAIAKNICLEYQLDSRIESILGDANRLQQILGNLLSNAIKFTPELGKIKVCLQQVENTAQIIVSDTGKGIPQELLPLIFERFRQGNDNQNKQKGLGLGLAIALHLVKLHGGTISVESPGEGEGTTFIVNLPLQQTTIGDRD
ncbi:PAS domain S-box protein [Rivularia sp. UHCC 0363]|uniref:hybrid sensor histidine kinase/response regulator n=1 Tax=Rivularia sp. UHCC 0363 TaxID=3110244 RepID=UPI002B2117A1|nr:PAS domain S-box protein [Rivularia sp. UHCC 0363]MEA5599017.1 PAS domain S-box protein [Rivularia sp. UHCC 0363]